MLPNANVAKVLLLWYDSRVMHAAQIAIVGLFAWLGYEFIADTQPERPGLAMLLFVGWGLMAAYGVTLVWLKFSGRAKVRTRTPRQEVLSPDDPAARLEPSLYGKAHPTPEPSALWKDNRRLGNPLPRLRRGWRKGGVE
jgi:hypothetical protein